MHSKQSFDKDSRTATVVVLEVQMEVGPYLFLLGRCPGSSRPHEVQIPLAGG